MVKKENNPRLRLLYLLKILSERTSPDKTLTNPQIIEALRGYNVIIERKTLYEDINALRNFGYEIGVKRSPVYGYYLITRAFELTELKLLADAISSSKFLTVKKSNELIAKLQQFTDKSNANQLKRYVYVANRVKSMNEQIYINVDAIHSAISQKRKIQFLYFDYNLSKKKVYRDGSRVVTPYALTWSEEKYYLICYYDKHPDELTHFRVDKMEAIKVLNEKGDKFIKNFNLTEYMKSVFSMFHGQTQTVKLQFDNSLLNAVYDRFGQGIKACKADDNHFTVSVEAAVSPIFYGWLFSFNNKVKILEPQAVKEEYKKYLTEVLTIYGN